MKPPLQQLPDLTYPVLESDVVVEPFELSEWWPRAYAMKVCCSQTAALWGTWDRNSDVIYLYSEHYLRHTEPSIHANAIKARGEWIRGAIDPTSLGTSQKDGTQLLTEYGRLGLNLVAADDAFEAGIEAVSQRLSSGRVKVFRTLSAWRSEFRTYRRDDKDQVAKENTLLMDCTRHLVLTGMKHADIDHDLYDEV